MTTIALTNLPLADNWNMHGAGWMAVPMIGMALFWGAIILGIVWLVRDGVQRRQPASQETALTILDRRFAEGTLSPDDYHQRRNVLTGANVPDPDKGGRSPAIEGAQR